MCELAFDVETDGLHHEDPLVTISFTSANKSVAFAVNHPEQENTERDALEKIQRIVDKASVLIGHNTKYDLKMLLDKGIKFRDDHVFVDTDILYWMYKGHREKQNALDKVAKAILGKEKEKGFDFKNRKASSYPLKGLLHYNTVDTDLTKGCYDKLWKKVNQNLLRFYSDVIQMYAHVEMNGLAVDEGLLVSMRSELTVIVEHLKSEMYNLLEYPINMNSPDQLSCALYGGSFTIKGGGTEEVNKPRKDGSIRTYTRKCDVYITLDGLGFSTKGLKKNKKGYWPTNKNVIAKLSGKTKVSKEYLKLFKEYRKYNGVLTKFIIPFINASHFGIMHPNINISGTSTGRASCSDPNLFNLKRATEERLLNPKLVVESRFEDGYLLDIDFSSAEWRIAAWRSQDEQMLQEIIDGIDPHKNMATRFLKIAYEDVDKETRNNMKSANFGMIYGQGGAGFAKRDDIPLIKTPKQGEKFKADFYEQYSGLAEQHERDEAVAMTTGKLTVESGRTYDFSGQYFVDTQIKNYPVQGLSSDMVMCCLIEVWKRLRDRQDALIVDSVYDCILVDCKNKEVALEIAKVVTDVFNNAHKYVRKYFPDIDLSTVPIECEAEIGQRWGQMEELHVEK